MSIDDEWLAQQIRLERMGVTTYAELETRAVSMGAMVPSQGPCQCDECKALQQHYQQQADAQQIVLTANGTSIPQGSLVQISGARGGKNGVFQVTGTQTGRLTVSKPNYANVPRSASPAPSSPGASWRSKGLKQKPKGDPLTEARNLLRRGKLRGKKQTLRILDHGPNWKQQGCGARFKVLRWQGGQPPEWTAVGWHLSVATYGCRRDAYLARKELVHVAEVMDS